MSDFNYDSLTDQEKEVYDNAFNWGWSSYAENFNNIEKKPYTRINTETLFWSLQPIFDIGYENGFESCKNFISKS